MFVAPLLSWLIAWVSRHVLLIGFGPVLSAVIARIVTLVVVMGTLAFLAYGAALAVRGRIDAIKRDAFDAGMIAERRRINSEMQRLNEALKLANRQADNLLAENERLQKDVSRDYLLRPTANPTMRPECDLPEKDRATLNGSFK